MFDERGKWESPEKNQRREPTTDYKIKKKPRHSNPGNIVGRPVLLRPFPSLLPLQSGSLRIVPAYIGKTIDINVSFQVTMSYLQIYQEKIYDLLNSTSKIELSLREHPVKGEQIYVTCTWVFVHVRLSLGVTGIRDN